MRKYFPCLLVLVALILFLPGCATRPPEIQASLDQEFSLAVNQSATVTGENLKIRFKDVVTDSRCPTGAVCVWRGEVSCLVEITRTNAEAPSFTLVLTQPGLSDEHPKQAFDGYQVSFGVEPYPEVGKQIEKDEYRLLFTVSRSTEVQASLGQEFSLAIGQGALIQSENLKIEFEDVIEDSRCPTGVVCIWQGRVSCVINITDTDSPYKMVLTEPGLTDQPNKEIYKNYQFTFHVQPYPEAGKQIAKDEYRLLLTVNKRP